VIQKIATMLRLVVLSMLTLGFCAGCEQDSSENQSNVFAFNEPEHVQLLNELLILQEDVGLGHVLKFAPERTITMMNAAINQARSGLLILAKTGQRTEAEKRMARTAFANAIRQYDEFRILDIEQERFDRVFNKVRYLKFQLGKELSLNSVEETWTVFNHNFSTSGLEPTFTTMGFAKNGKPNDEARWFTNFQTDLPKARVQGRDGAYGWMISRPFDLTQVENPTFRFFGSYLVVAPSSVLPLAQVIREVFKTYILLDYKPGDNPEDYPPDRKIFVEYDLDKLPLGKDFDDAWTPDVSLTPYRDRSVAIGFLFDTRGINFTQYYSWTIFDFEINGAGRIPDDPVKYKEEFQGANLGFYKSYSTQFPGEMWTTSKDKASIVFTATQENLSETIDSYLLSPKLDIPKEMLAPELRIEESFLKQNFKNENLQNFEILISKNYHGGESPENAEWQLLERVADTSLESEDRLTFTQRYSLAEHLGQEVVVAFRFRSKDRIPENHVIDWSIESVQILGQEANVAVIDYVLPPRTSLAFFDFLAATVGTYQILKESNSPSWQKKDAGFIITGFNGVGNPPSLGPTRLIFPVVDLAGKADVRFRMKQKVFHFKENSQSSEVMKVQIRKQGTTEWTTLQLPPGTFRPDMPRDPELSGWIKIPSEYLGQKVEFSLFYQSRDGNGGTVEWTFASFEVGGK
jgi:hypothetical protein